MADGSLSFNFPHPQISRLRPDEIIVDLFAGGGGASEALKQAIGRDPDSVSPPPLCALAKSNLDTVETPMAVVA